MIQAGPVRTRVWVLSLAISAILLCSVGLVNGGPIYYPDTGAYLIDANRLFHLQAPFAVRPVFYGLAIWPFHWGKFFTPALLAQGFIVAHIIYLTVRCCGCELRPLGFLSLISALVALTPVSFHVSHLLPDIFVSVLILAMFLLSFCLGRLDRLEMWYLVLIATAATTFHLTAMPVGLAVFMFSFLQAIVTRRSLKAPLLALTPIVLAIMLLLSFSAAVFAQLTLTPKNPPHLLARILADGPGRDFLSRTCPRSGFILCDYQARLTPIEDDFLWRLLPSIPPADAFRIKAEQGAVERGTFTMFPVQVIKHMLSNTLRQLVTFQSETQVSDAEWKTFQNSGTLLARSLKGSLQGKRYFEKPALDAVNAYQGGVAMVSLLALLLVTGLAIRAGLFRPAALAATVLTGLISNALACGAFGGVFGRYEGRVVWLLPLTAVVGVLALLRDRPLLPYISSGSSGIRYEADRG